MSDAAERGRNRRWKWLAVAFALFWVVILLWVLFLVIQAYLPLFQMGF